MQASSIARPYARAAFDIAIERDNVDSWTEVLSALASIIEQKEFIQLLINPSITDSNIIEIIHTLIESLTVEQQNFIKVLVENKSLQALNMINELFKQLLNDSQNITVATVSSAIQLTSEQKQQIEERLSLIDTNKILSVKYIINQQLLGGLLINIDNRIIDTTLSNSLVELKKHLTN